MDVPVHEDVVVSKLKDEIDELLLQLQAGVFVWARAILEDRNGIHRLAIHYANVQLLVDDSGIDSRQEQDKRRAGSPTRLDIEGQSKGG